jgi:GNAT superfamily N-acetyltransferase
MMLEEFSLGYLDQAADAYVRVFNSTPWNDGWTHAAARERLQRMMAHPNHLGIVACDAGLLLGFASGCRERWIRADDFHLKEMCVLRDRQRQGIGTAILSELGGRLRTLGVETTYLETRPRSPAAGFYEKHGFRVLHLQSMSRKEAAGAWA